MFLIGRDSRGGYTLAASACAMMMVEFNCPALVLFVLVFKLQAPQKFKWGGGVIPSGGDLAGGSLQ